MRSWPGVARKVLRMRALAFGAPGQGFGLALFQQRVLVGHLASSAVRRSPWLRSGCTVRRIAKMAE